MTTQPFDPAEFSPEDLAHMTAAYAGALTIASDEGSPFTTIPAHDLRRRLARAIMREARSGVRDPNQLRAGALRGLRL